MRKEMEKSLFKKLIWPKSAHVELLSKILGEEKTMELISFFANRPVNERLVRFPKKVVILKLVTFYFGQKEKRGEMTWPEIMNELKGKFRTLKELGLSRKEVKRLYKQRLKEISKGR